MMVVSGTAGLSVYVTHSSSWNSIVHMLKMVAQQWLWQAQTRAGLSNNRVVHGTIFSLAAIVYNIIAAVANWLAVAKNLDWE